MRELIEKLARNLAGAAEAWARPGMRTPDEQVEAALAMLPTEALDRLFVAAGDTVLFWARVGELAAAELRKRGALSDA